MEKEQIIQRLLDHLEVSDRLRLELREEVKGLKARLSENENPTPRTATTVVFLLLRTGSGKLDMSNIKFDKYYNCHRLKFQNLLKKELGLTRIIHELPIPKPNYLQSREMLEIFTPQNWGDNCS